MSAGDLVLPFRLTPDRRRKDSVIAHHEAGHATAAVLHGWRVKVATIIADHNPRDGTEAYEGRVILTRRRTRASDSTFWSARRLGVQDLLIRFAGPQAQRRHAPKSGIPAAAASDHKTAATIVSLWTASRRSGQALSRHVFLETANFIDLHWAEVSAVAKLLLDRRCVRHAEIVEVTDRIAERRAQDACAITEDDLVAMETAVEELRFRRRRAEPVPRRILDRALAHALLDSLAIGKPLNASILRRYIEGESYWRNIDPTTAMEKFDLILQRHRERLAWRPVVTTP